MAQANKPDRPTILIISHTNLARDPRVNRQIRFLREDFNVVAAGTSSPELESVTFVPLEPYRAGLLSQLSSAAWLLLRQFDTWYWRHEWIRAAHERLSAVNPDLVIANEMETLPLALKLARGAPVVFDAHEYFPTEYEDRLAFRVFFQRNLAWAARTYLPQAAAMMTVGPRIAERFHAEFGVAPVVILNAPDFEELEPNVERLPGSPVRIVHHGIAHTQRRLESLIDLAQCLDQRFEIHFYLVEGTPGYLQQLRSRAAENGRVIFHEPVGMRELARTLSQYDLGIFVLPPVTFNSRYVLPNKLFEFIQARLAIAIGPSPEMAHIVRAHDLGIVADDFSNASMARALGQLTDADLKRYRLNAHRVARQYSSDAARAQILTLTRRLLNSR